MFACMGGAVKAASPRLGNETVVFFRNFFGLLALFPLVWRSGVHALKVKELRFYFVRTLFGLGAMYCFFYAIAHLRLADAVLLNYTMPLFVPFIAKPWLGERIFKQAWLGVGVGFLGVILVLKPGVALFKPIALIGLLAGLLGAVAQVSVRKLTHTEPIVRIVFYFGALSTCLSALPLVRSWRTPHGDLWLVLILMGAAATAGQLFLTSAYAHAPAARVGPFIYTIVVFAGLLDWGVWRVLPDRWSIVGAVLICVGGVTAIRRTPEAPAVDAYSPLGLLR
jgi:drug/metabolite transporter (DMT)-like permease